MKVISLDHIDDDGTIGPIPIPTPAAAAAAAAAAPLLV
eukprot:CAMPEP_0194707386 /NCGR_PEP_ID=MMETSP0295-20121207/30120_1 /TAXON_ID=39354 /ORGANISM="Heterosigma akashiwo, Strain CCMP2393" /LENGTH=37 /DNA_ID= /DNA_START= /DNA_END= /DNA_ORIENTATION=